MAHDNPPIPPSLSGFGLGLLHVRQQLVRYFAADMGRRGCGGEGDRLDHCGFVQLVRRPGSGRSISSAPLPPTDPYFNILRTLLREVNQSSS